MAGSITVDCTNGSEVVHFLQSHIWQKLAVETKHGIFLSLVLLKVHPEHLGSISSTEGDIPDIKVLDTEEKIHISDIIAIKEVA